MSIIETETVQHAIDAAQRDLAAIGGRVVRFRLPNHKIDGVLTPNSRSHWSVKAKASRLAKNTTIVLCRDAVQQHGYADGADFLQGFGTLELRCFRYFCGQAKMYDQDNLASGFKPYIDGIARALSGEGRLVLRPHLLEDHPEVAVVDRKALAR